MHRSALSPRVSRVSTIRATLAPGFALALTLACTACDRNHRPFLAPDQPPTVTLTSGPVDTLSAPQAWLVDIAWTATDPDGAIDHFEYAVDPPTLKQASLALAETAWVATRENHVVAHFHASHPDTLGPGATASQFHVFVLRAVDDRGGISPRVVRAFYAYTVAPDVQITRPIPYRLLRDWVPIPFRAEWRGHDPDGEGTGRPAYYRTRLLRLEYANQVYLSDPDSLLREGFSTGWADWNVVSADTSSQVITSGEVPPGVTAALAVLAVDEAGATTPYLSLDRNFLQFSASPPDAGGPMIHVWSSLVDYTYRSGGYLTGFLHEIAVEAGDRQTLEFHWDGRPSPGRTVVASRWMLDGDPFNDTPRPDSTDLYHWSALGGAEGEARLPPLIAYGAHRLYIELRDDFGERSLGIVRISVVDITPNRDLLVVNDTRREVDRFLRDPTHRTPDPYTVAWPSRTELDTFLFARGGYPWRGTVNPDTGVISPPGLLAGYAYDTLGTRLGLDEAADGVPLSTLGRYRHVLWLVDPRGALLGGYRNDVTALRDMSGPDRASTLAAYVAMGGQVWLAGGGAAYASLIGFNRSVNDAGSLTVFTARDDELGPGRPLYDAAHVRSALAVAVSNAQAARSPAARGGWSGHGPEGTLAAPDYTHAPASLSLRSVATDPLPPTRLRTQADAYYVPVSGTEFVRQPNEITEDFDPDPDVVRLESALDTVYEASATAPSISAAPVMLYYHGRENEPFVFTGLDLWSWRRADCQGLVDFVLRDIWGLPKSAPSAGSRAGGSAAVRAQGPVRTVPLRRLDPHRMRP